MAENLNYDGKEDGVSEIGVCYDNNSNHCEAYGRLYTWEDANNACPDGWRLPSNTGWNTLVSYVGSNNAGRILMARSFWGGPNYGDTDAYGFSALPSWPGADYGYWWSATEVTSNTNNAVYSSIKRTDSNVYIDNGNKTNQYSVRCEQK
jgi:uncharacterized protein (TIGR02145 family)